MTYQELLHFQLNLLAFSYDEEDSWDDTYEDEGDDEDEEDSDW